ncbi:tannase-domain-containing protein [Thozetella sp. PMI_491]|nr:tannase-domain-containing protein [Thozetella sp. PMI_491]
MGYMEDIYTADFTSLKVFRDKDGKILHYQGWADGVVAPGFNLQLFQETIDDVGYDVTSSFHQLFIYPGMTHSDVGYNINGTVGWRIDYYDALMSWLDTGVPPSRLIVQHWNITNGAPISTRPYFPYPNTPKYVGSINSSLDDPDSWTGAVVPCARRSALSNYQGLFATARDLDKQTKPITCLYLET